MGNDAKIRFIGAKMAPTPLTIEALAAFAERVIRTDKEAALKSQKNRPDLAQPSNDRPATTTPKISALRELSAKTGTIKITASDAADEESTPKIVSISAIPGKS